VNSANPSHIKQQKKIDMDLLRFITAGSVDDGKSTLIGRLLYDSKSILVDQLEALERQTKNKVNGEIDLALLTDGLRAEREQGITIDVAYKYFSTPNRKFIIADAPGHIQYTRNMVTGASNSELVVILIDARQGVVEQTRRHSIIASLLRLPHVVVAVNKMDLVNYDEQVFSNIVNEFSKIAAKLGLEDVTYIPISALDGDNIVTPSANMAWYSGKPLLKFLESVEVKDDGDLVNARFPVQYVIRPQTAALHDYRGYAGKILSGTYCKGDEVTVLPAGVASTIDRIEHNLHDTDRAFAGQSVVMHLSDDVDVSRGDVIVKRETSAKVSTQLEVLLCWMDTKPLLTGNKYQLQLNSSRMRAVVQEIAYKLDVNTLENIPYDGTVRLNEVVKATIKTASPLAHDAYKTLRANGGLILIDETSNITVGACMIQEHL
jgi:sulfate adenylyltransferase subunit 1